MKILILDGNPDPNDTPFEEYLADLANEIQALDNEVKRIKLRDLNIRYCTGCWGCWVKTPGECKVADGSRHMCREYINSDLVLFASPITMGFTSALLKKAHEKLLPLLLPYLELVQNECHHVSRYQKYPLMGLLLEKSKGTDEEDVKIITDIYKRDAINFKTSFCFTKLTDDPVEEVANEINRI